VICIENLAGHMPEIGSTERRAAGIHLPLRGLRSVGAVTLRDPSSPRAGETLDETRRAAEEDA
jgi:hypothetical protein